MTPDEAHRATADPGRVRVCGMATPKITDYGIGVVSCDVCGRFCSRTHRLVAYGTDTICCDDCFGYDAEAYGEAPDPL